MTGASLGALENLVMITAIAASAAMVALLLLARPGFIVSPKSVHKPAPEVPREQELLSQHNQIVQRLTKDFWRRYDHLVAKRQEETLIPDSPEHRELIRMTDEMECLQAERLVLLSELAKLRGTSLAEVLKHPDVAVRNHG